MAEATATPAQGGIDQNAINTAVASALTSLLPAAIAAATKPLEDRLAAFQADKPAAEKAGTAGAAAAAKPLTAEEVARIVAEQVKQARSSDQQTAERERHLETKLNDLPPAYRAQLGTDKSKWEAEEQAIRNQYKADFKAAGGTVGDVSGDNPAGAVKPGAAVDLSKLSPVQLVELGLKTSTPIGAGKPMPAAAAGGAADATAK